MLIGGIAEFDDACGRRLSERVIGYENDSIFSVTFSVIR